MAYKEYLKRLHDERWFQQFVEEEMKPRIPSVPSYNPNEDNTSRWKYDSAMREGFLLCMSILGVKND